MKKQSLFSNDNKLVFFVILLFVSIAISQTYFSYFAMQNEQKRFALAESKILNDYMLTHRNYYIDLYANKTIKLDQNTLEGLPAYSARPIATRFSDANDYGIKIKLASDRPRNEKNLADKQELQAIKYFNENQNKKEYFKLIEDTPEPYYQYGSVLKIKKACLVCHSQREKAPLFIRERYSKAYGYKIGEVRGLISIKIPKKHASEYTQKMFIDQILFNTFTFIFLFILGMYLFFKRSKVMKKLQEQTDKADSANVAKSEFLANMSHEIRSPLNAILGFVHILKTQKNDKKSLEYLEIIDNSSQNLLQIIEDILDFSKIESGKLAIDKIDFNTRVELQTIAHLFQTQCLEKNINLSVEIDENLPKFINTDPLRVKQVLTNLLSNAIKFTKSGKNIAITIKYIKNHLFISVKDEGKGISKDKLKHIFEVFTQEDSSTTREFGGTGLGLSISSELIKLLGGVLKVKSELGVGSEFYFAIPVDTGKEKNDSQIISKDIIFNGEKILLVEDNISNQMFMKVILKKLSLKYDIANDGLEAIELFKKNRYNAILMDENMPNLNGIETTMQILSIEKEKNLQHTPIIALTANALKGDRDRFLNAGMDEYMTKPVNKKKLVEILSKFLHKNNN